MKILLVMAHGKVHEHVGGAPKIFFEMANELSKDNDILAVYSDDRIGEPLYKTNGNVRLINLKLDEKKTKPFYLKIVREFFRTLDKLPFLSIKYNPITSKKQKLIGDLLKENISDFFPDIIISFGVSDIVSLSGIYNGKAPIVLMCHTSPKRVFSELSNREVKSINKARVIQTLLPSYAKVVKKFVGENIEVISLGNPIPDFNNDANISCKKIIYMARIEKNKQQHKLIECFSKIPLHIRSEWEVDLFGSDSDIEYKNYLVSLSKQLGIEKSVNFRGVTTEIHDSLRNASICAFPSVFEGFPLSLSEAMSCGLACIGYESCSGVNEIITNNKNGYLASDDDDFSNKLQLLMENEKVRAEFGSEAYHDIKEYHSSQVWDSWRCLLKKIEGPASIQ
ncbi:glycosyltransferase [Parasalinivibrio latis]|uniref:glycosyltransferase n=1 Tax=Parasalinivibrio latis TaxID=2952610 RepID=UPI0030E27C26